MAEHSPWKPIRHTPGRRTVRIGMTMYLWDYREFIGNLAVSESKIKYSNFVLGFSWSLFNYLMMESILIYPGRGATWLV